ncbi:hypothetical protein OUZ56_001830 [Daphnia magna]|uniref:Uncharacterized protein n=1 Tax=Daphnia magna TaxID=35525 RepID=A0ABR0A4C2_9CRUS|nr:hypothetical protein OUZ56_001830 [Daphnia magna]
MCDHQPFFLKSDYICRCWVSFPIPKDSEKAGGTMTRSIPVFNSVSEFRGYTDGPRRCWTYYHQMLGQTTRQMRHVEFTQRF